MAAATRLSWALLVLGACVVDLDDRPGRACDESTPCRAPRRCVRGACFADDERPGSDGGAAGGSAGGLVAGGLAGGGSAGGGAFSGGGAGGSSGGAAVDGGPLWQQRLQGFASVTEDTGCTATIDPSRGNVVVASSQSTRDSEDTASADVLSPLPLPMTLEGAVRGRLTLGATPRLPGAVPFLELGAQPSRVHLQLSIASAQELEVSSQAGTVADQAVSARYRLDGGWQRGDYLFEVRWRRGESRRVLLDGQLLGEVPLPATGSGTPPDRLRLGILRMEGTDGGPFSVTMTGWQLGDRLTTPLGDVQ